MHISDVHDYSFQETEAAKEFIAKNRKAQIKSEIDQLVDDEFDRLEEYADEFISQTAASRAERFLERVLKGDDDAARALIHHDGSRYRDGCDAGKPWASLIHGRLFETGGIELRRKIVEAHPELIRNERITDLESIVDGLSQQVRSLEADLKACRERLVY